MIQQLILLIGICQSFNSDFNSKMSCNMSFVEPNDFSDWPKVSDPIRGLRPADGWTSSQYDIVYLNINHWNDINLCQKRQLIYHELGHKLGLDHTTKQNSIMNPFGYYGGYWGNEKCTIFQTMVKDMQTTLGIRGQNK